MDKKNIRPFNDPSGKIVPLSENSFMGSNGELYLPSYLTQEETEQLSPITRNYQDPNYDSLKNSVKNKRRYNSSLDYSSLLEKMNDLDLMILSFIGGFSSVQKLHVYRQCELFKNKLEQNGKALTLNDADKSLKRLEQWGLILKNNFEKQDQDGKKRILCYTLDVEGYLFLKNYFASSLYVNNPDDMFLKRKYEAFSHLRCWECVDVYQFFQSLPSFKGFNTSFSGTKQDLPHPGGPLVYSPLQVSLRIMYRPNVEGVLNLVCYPCIQTDRVDFYKKVVDRWEEWISTDKKGNPLEKPNVHKEIPRLLPGLNALAIIVPDEATATYLNANLELYKKDSLIVFIVLNRIQSRGVLHALLLPNEQHYDEVSESYVGKLEEWKIKELLTG